MRIDDPISEAESRRQPADGMAASPALGAGAGERPYAVYSPLGVTRHLALPMASRRRSGSDLPLGTSRLVATVVGLLGGCAPDEELPLPPVVWEGESVRVRMDDPEIEVCGGSFEALDRHVELVRETLLLEGDGVVEYSIGDVDFVDERCNSDSPIACTKATTGIIFTTEPFIQHEIVHAVRVLDPRISLHSSPIEEGLATLFGSDDLPQGTVPLEAKSIFEDTNVVGDAEYFRAGYLMALLLKRHAVDRFHSFDLLARDRPEDQSFQEAFGQTKADFAAIADAAPLCDASEWWVPLLECDGEPMLADPETGRASFNGNLRCGDDRTVGPRRGQMWTSRHFRLDAPTSRFNYEIDMPDDARLEVVSCDNSCPERFAYSGTRYEVVSFGNALPDLEPGEYLLRVSRPVSDDDGWFEIVLEQ